MAVTIPATSGFNLAYTIWLSLYFILSMLKGFFPVEGAADEVGQRGRENLARLAKNNADSEWCALAKLFVISLKSNASRMPSLNKASSLNLKG